MKTVIRICDLEAVATSNSFWVGVEVRFRSGRGGGGPRRRRGLCQSRSRRVRLSVRTGAAR
jgi:hypothetical protein